MAGIPGWLTGVCYQKCPLVRNIGPVEHMDTLHCTLKFTANFDVVFPLFLDSNKMLAFIKIKSIMSFYLGKGSYEKKSWLLTSNLLS